MNTTRVHTSDRANNLGQLETLEHWRHRLLLLVDLGLASVIFIAPLFMGGRNPVGRLVLVAAISIVVVAWALRQCLEKRATWEFSGAECLLLGGLGLVVLQLHEPAWFLTSISPGTLELLPLWTSAGDPSANLGTWNQVSLDPVATRGGLAVYLAYVLLFLVVVQRVRSLDDVERLFRWIALAAVGMATLGLWQFLLSNGKFLWIYQHPSRDTYRVVKGTFANQNHFAHFLALGIGPLIWWLQRLYLGDERTQFSTKRFAPPAAASRGTSHRWTTGFLQDQQTLRLLLFVGLGVLLLAGLLTFSRGGVIALFIAGAVTVTLYISTSLLPKKTLALVAVISVMVGSTLLIHGYEPLATRLRTLRDARSLDDLSRARLELWSAHCAAVPNFPLLGTGVGTHRELYPTYMPEHYDVEFTHAENGYLHLLVETGVLGLACMLAGIGLCVLWCIRILIRGGRGIPLRRHVAGAAVILAAISASVVHSLGDFVWYIPACMSLTVILAGCACRLRQLFDAETVQGEAAADEAKRPAWRRALQRFLLGPAVSWSGPRPVWIGAAVGIVALNFGMVRDRLSPALRAPHWDRYLALSLPFDASTLDDQQIADQASAMAHHLEQTLKADPDFPRANVRMAAVLLRLFELAQKTAENPMSLTQIRDAALASRFPTREAQDAWLNIAVGENRKLLDRALDHCYRALRLCPMQGDGYIYLADLCFLNGPTSGTKGVLVAQAQMVRPYNGFVQFAAGKEAALSGDLETALQHWKQAFDNDPEIRSLIIESFADNVSAGDFLDVFEPKIDGLSLLFRHYRNSGQDDDARIVAAQYTKALERGARSSTSLEASNYWHQARDAYSYLGANDQALVCGQRAVELDPSNFTKHHKLAKLLMDNQQFTEAAKQFQWCLHRKPDDKGLSRQLANAKRHSIQRQSSTAVVPTKPHQRSF